MSEQSAPTLGSDVGRSDFRALAAAVGGGTFRLDPRGRLEAADDAFVGLTGRDREALFDERVSIVAGGEGPACLDGAVRRLRTGDRKEASLTVPVVWPGGRRRRCRVGLAAVTEDGSFDGSVGILWPAPPEAGDASDAVADTATGAAADATLGATADATSSATADATSDATADAPSGVTADASGSVAPDATADVYGRITDAVFALDEEWRFTYLNRRAERVLGRDESELLGRTVWEQFPEAVESAFRTEYERAMETQEPVSFEECYGPLDAWFEVRAYPSETGLSVYFRDVTDRVHRENELQERERALREAYQVVSDADRSFAEQVTELLRIGREAVGTDYGTLSRVRDDEYVFEEVHAADDGVQAGDRVPLAATNCERVVENEETLALRDVPADAPELADRAGNAEWGISCYIGAPVFVDGDVYGTFCFYDTEPRSRAFSDWEVTFVDLLGSWISYELDCLRITERLTALNELDAVVREVTDAVIDRPTREEIERVACECLAAADSYLFAWIGEADPTDGEVRVRAEAGVENYLADATISVDPDVPEGRGPTGRALRTGEIQTTQDVREDETYEPWRDHEAAYGYRSSAAVPITHEGSAYGVLNVYAERPDAFDGEERSVIEHLGATLGHAIAAADRKRALMDDTVVELDLRIRDVLADLNAPDAPEGRAAFDRVVPTGDGGFLVFGTASPGGVEMLEAIVERATHWTELAIEASKGVDAGADADSGADADTNADTHVNADAVTSGGDGAIGFELRLSEPPMLSAVASLGGSVERAVLEDGDYRVTLHLPQGADVRRIVDTVEETFPGAEIRSQRGVTRPADGTGCMKRAWTEDLTDRQREVLETAYFKGFFEWPRASTGEEIADSLDVANATSSQHLRAAENKLFGALLDGGSGERDESAGK